MNTVGTIYDTEENISEDGIQYFFVSKGRNDIFKVVQYLYVQDFLGRKVYNLGFGNYDAENDLIVDDEITNNGDHYRVFNTVLSTIPNFFKTYEDAMMMVQGSDSKLEFIEKCRQTCKRKCGDERCKNSNRRIRLYRNYVNKNYSALTEEFVFYGGNRNIDNHIVIEAYQKDEKYDSLFLEKKPKFAR
jgi:hypothetical protein